MRLTKMKNNIIGSNVTKAEIKTKFRIENVINILVLLLLLYIGISYLDIISHNLNTCEYFRFNFFVLITKLF